MDGRERIEVEELTLDQILSSCRLCQDKRRAATVYISTSVSVLDAINHFFNININQNDGFPQQICLKCESMIHLMSDFCKEVAATNEKLQEFFKNKPQNLASSQEPEMESPSQELNVQIINYVDQHTDDFEICDNHDTESLGYQVILLPDKNQSLSMTETVNHSPDLIQTKPKRVRKKTSTCEICGRRVEGPSKLQRHMRVHQDVPRKPRSSKDSKSIQEQVIYVCTVCDKQVFSQIKLRKHMESHLPKEMRPKCHSCDKCGNKYLDAASLRVHISLKHSNNVPSFACSICGSKFTRKNYRDYHERQHNSEKKFSCDFCEFKTLKRHNLKRHIKCFHVL